MGKIKSFSKWFIRHDDDLILDIELRRLGRKFAQIIKLWLEFFL